MPLSSAKRAQSLQGKSPSRRQRAFREWQKRYWGHPTPYGGVAIAVSPAVRSPRSKSSASSSSTRMKLPVAFRLGRKRNHPARSLKAALSPHLQMTVVVMSVHALINLPALAG